MTVANNYNLNFKEEMDESLYKLVVGYVTLDTIETDKSLKNPYTLIDELRSEFTRLTAITTESEKQAVAGEPSSQYRYPEKKGGRYCGQHFCRRQI
ncbi:MAG: hypothetical protein ACLSGK_15035 [Lachnospiraceae bacterium]